VRAKTLIVGGTSLNARLRRDVQERNPHGITEWRCKKRISIMVVVEQFIRDSSERVALIVNVSGGKDSTRMLGFIHSQFPDIPTYCVMADTGFEHVRPVSAVEGSRQIAERFGMELHVVRNPNKTYLEMVRARGGWR
jgi:3'-phosphoadenosine 5'-phosphosulfate sulfotransferase (PAPS reductase)/FAD synthetase